MPSGDQSALIQGIMSILRMHMLAQQQKPPSFNSVGSGQPMGPLWSQQAFMRHGGVGLPGMDPRFFDDPRFAPISRHLALDTPEGGNRGWIVKMGKGDVSSPEVRDASGGWDSAPVGTGSRDDWTVGQNHIDVGYAVDQPTQTLMHLLQKLIMAPSAKTNLGTDSTKLGGGAPNFVDPWMFDNAKSVAGNQPNATSNMVEQFRQRMLDDLSHRPEMMY